MKKRISVFIERVVTYMSTYPVMRSNVLMLFLVGVINVSFSQSNEEKFTLVRKAEDQGIYVYERWIEFTDANPPYKAREVKGDFPIGSSIEEAIQLLKDEKRIKEWQHHVSDFAVFPTDDSSTWYEYSYHDIPWPVSDQDHYLRYSIKESSSEKVLIAFESIRNDKFPEKEDVTRMHLSGSWTFTKKHDGKVMASYRIQSKPIGIPRIFTDPVIRNNIMTTIERYMDILNNGVTR